MKQLFASTIDAFTERFTDAKCDVQMSRHTYLKIGGTTRVFLSTDDDAVLVDAIRFAQKLDVPWYVLGGGSNLLISDAGFEGIILQSTNRTIYVTDDLVVASSGATTALVARKSVDSGLSGFEWGIGVPGTIGGAVFGNAGCFGGEMKDVVASVTVYNINNDRIESYAGEISPEKNQTDASCDFGYRDSAFKHEPSFILNVTLHLHAGDQVESKKKMNDIIFARQETQPQGTFSAGCLFKNVEYENVNVEHDLTQVTVPEEFIQKNVIPAGWLIDQCGLKGTRVGDAEVSNVHANFVINRGKATANDIHNLFLLIQKSVQQKTGIKLENEVQFLM